MIIVMKQDALRRQVEAVIDLIEKSGLKPVLLEGSERRVIAVIGDERTISKSNLLALPGVAEVLDVVKPYKLVAREGHKQGSIIDIKGVKFGGPEIIVIAGPCSVESDEQFLKIARDVKASGAKVLRGGAFKWRTSPHDFQGLGLDGLKFIKEAKEETGLLAATEVLDPRQVEVLAQYTDILQIGTVSMQNYPLLRECGRSGMPIILKRGKWATYKEYLLAAEYIMAEGNEKVILCERGIRTFETETRHTFDINAIPFLKAETHLPVFADPSHGTGIAALVPAISKAAIAAGADGLIIETHYDPKHAASDAAQTIATDVFTKLMQDIRKIAPVVGREF